MHMSVFIYVDTKAVTEDERSNSNIVLMLLLFDCKV